MIPIRINNNTYKSISEAWREMSPAGLPQITVRWRLKNGWTTHDAFLVGAVVPKQRRMFKGVRNI